MPVKSHGGLLKAIYRNNRLIFNSPIYFQWQPTKLTIDTTIFIPIRRKS